MRKLVSNAFWIALASIEFWWKFAWAIIRRLLDAAGLVNLPKDFENIFGGSGMSPLGAALILIALFALYITNRELWHSFWNKLTSNRVRKIQSLVVPENGSVNVVRTTIASLMKSSTCAVDGDTLLFDCSTREAATWDQEVPRDWVSSPVQFRVQWSRIAESDQYVGAVFSLRGKPSDDIALPFYDGADSTGRCTKQNYRTWSEWSELKKLTSACAGDIYQFEISRNVVHANDTIPEYVRLHAVQVRSAMPT